MDRVNELLAEIKATLKEESRKENNLIVTVFAVIGILAAVGLVAYLLYRFLQPDYYDDYDDSVYDDEYEDEVPVPDADVEDAPESDEESEAEAAPVSVAEGAPIAEESDFAE